MIELEELWFVDIWFPILANSDQSSSNSAINPTMIRAEPEENNASRAKL